MTHGRLQTHFHCSPLSFLARAPWCQPWKGSLLINSIWQISGCSRSNRSIPHPPIRSLLCYVAAVTGWRQDNACIIRWEGYRKVFWDCNLEPKPQVSGPASVTSEAVLSVLDTRVFRKPFWGHLSFVTHFLDVESVCGYGSSNVLILLCCDWLIRCLSPQVLCWFSGGIITINSSCS